MIIKLQIAPCFDMKRFGNRVNNDGDSHDTNRESLLSFKIKAWGHMKIK